MATLWFARPELFPWVALVLGLCVGSFLNVVIHRLPRMMEREWAEQCAELGTGETQVSPVPPSSDLGPKAVERYNLVVPRSQCPSCGHRITALENVPVVSWLALRAK